MEAAMDVVKDFYQSVKAMDFAKVQALGLLVGVGLLASAIILGIYNLWFHPLRDIPGPLLWRTYYFPYCYSIYRGTIVDRVTKFHSKYGPVVRLSPNQLSFSGGERVWQDIYNYHPIKSPDGKVSYKASWLKDMGWFAPGPNNVDNVLITNEADHARHRRILSHAFSDKAIREQEPLVTHHVNLLVEQLRKRADGQQRLDLVQWYDFVTFDVISDLMFGAPFGALKNGGHPHIELIFEGVRAMMVTIIMRAYPFLLPFIFFFISPRLLKKLTSFYAWVNDTVSERLDSKKDRPDFIGFMLREHGNVKKDIDMSGPELASNAGLLLQAGSETTSTMMAGTTYFLSQNPEKLEKLKKEVRGAFKSSNDITVDALIELPYLEAVIKESLRIFPPVPTGFPRRVPQGGGTVNGIYVPAGTSLYVSHIAAYRSPANFRDPDQFLPERWLGDDPKFKDDRLDMWQAFSYGPRNCIGKNLAWMEMRMLLSNMMCNFDIELLPESRDWFQRCKCFALWDKPSLAVRLTTAC